MRIVLDTNVLARAMASPGGPAGELLEQTLAGHTLVVSVELLSELTRVLAYPRVRRLHGRSDEEVAEFIGSIETSALVVQLPSPMARIVPHDPDDDMLVATALAGRADALCTRNRHLFDQQVVTHCGQHGVAVMDDLALLGQLREGFDVSGE